MAVRNKYLWTLYMMMLGASLCSEQTERPISFSEGNELYDAGLYAQAAEFYRTIVDENPDSAFSDEARFHLGQAYFALGKYSNTIEVLSNLKAPLDDSTYLLALAYSRSGDYPNSIKAIETFLKSNPTSHRNEAQFELGQAYFLSKDYEQAKTNFEKINQDSDNTKIYFLSQLYLAKIELVKGDPKKASEILTPLENFKHLAEALNYELFFLQGEARFQQENYLEALNLFQKALPASHPQNYSWYPDTLYYIGQSYIRLAEATNNTSSEEYFNKAEQTLEKLLAARNDENSIFALGQLYLARAKKLSDQEAYLKAEAILSQSDKFKTIETRAHALLLRAEAAPSYHERANFYQQLTQSANQDSSFYPNGWYMRALNEYEYALKENDVQMMEKASESFATAYSLLKKSQPNLAGSALKFQALALGNQNSPDKTLTAYNLINELIIEQAPLRLAMDHPDEILYLHGFYASQLASRHPEFMPIAITSLEKAANIPNAKFGDAALNHLGALYYRNRQIKDAEQTYLKLATTYPSSNYAGEAWYWAASCADKLSSEIDAQTLTTKEDAQQRRRRCFEEYPLSPYAAEAYFSYYTYAEYLQGDRNAIKHLQQLSKLFPDTPILIEANYLIGLDYKRDRKTPEGKWIRRRSLTEAIDAFQNVEALFDRIDEKDLISDNKFNYFVAVRYRATLERAMANLSIAEESQGAKRQIYLEYAEEVFKGLISELTDPHNTYANQLFLDTGFPSIYEESLYWLGQTFVKGQNDEEAQKTFIKMIEKYENEKITRSFYLSRVWDEMGKIALRQKNYTQSLQSFKKAEDAAKGANILSTDQRLDLWIQQSFCYRGLKQYDQAILLLSKVVNDNAISSLRMKAMYLRAETYEEQGRPELARKQLESIVKKGGVWSKLAQEKLDKVSP